MVQGAPLISEFAVPTREQWSAKVNADALGRTTEDGVVLQALYTQADAGPRASAAPAGALAVGRLHDEGDGSTLASSLTTDAGRGVDVAWVELALAQRSAYAGLRGPGATVGDSERDAVLVGPGRVVLDAGAAASAWLRALPKAHRVQGIVADPIGVYAHSAGRSVSPEAALVTLANDTKWAAQHHPGLKTALLSGSVVHDAGATDAQEIAAVIAAGLAWLQTCEAQGVAPEVAAAATVLMVSVEHAPFDAIAKLRAVRQLWSAVLTQAGAGHVSPVIWARSSTRARTRLDVENNLLRATLEAFAAATGGADGALIVPHTHAAAETDDDAVRLAINTQLVLRDESGLSRVADPGGGSWAIEAATDGLARAAWRWTQQWQSEGGVVAALQSGRLQAAVAQSAQARADAVATRTVALTGVSLFPDLGRAPADGPVTDNADEGPTPLVALTPRRLATPFEALREAAAGATQTPRAQLVRLGPAAAVRPFVEFAAGVLAAGGVAVEAVDGCLTSDSGDAETAVVVLCGSPELVAQHAVAAAGQAKQRGATCVLTTGRPPDDVAQELRGAGVDGFVYRGANLVDILQTVHVALSLTPRTTTPTASGADR